MTFFFKLFLSPGDFSSGTSESKILKMSGHVCTKTPKTGYRTLYRKAGFKDTYLPPPPLTAM
jgi:hypothetical protein